MELIQDERMQNNIATIKQTLPLPDIYDQLAEEASELAQAANKMARILRGNNPTPKTEKEAMTDLIEEYTDVIVCQNVLDIHTDILLADYKLYRWRKRLEDSRNRIHDNSLYASCSASDDSRSKQAAV